MPRPHLTRRRILVLLAVLSGASLAVWVALLIIGVPVADASAYVGTPLAVVAIGVTAMTTGATAIRAGDPLREEAAGFRDGPPGVPRIRPPVGESEITADDSSQRHQR
ncbi:hypothetical protein ACFY5C_23390 [Streptomyces sp. NPDC012935]|uniref:hypothetical protein n=1 Tax=Streptomyces sp. NPDC012935 TaxID=3364857 RepID=UPI00367A472E